MLSPSRPQRLVRIGWWLLAVGLALLLVSVVVNFALDQGWFQPPNRILVQPVTAGDIAAVITSVSGLIAAVAGLITALTGLTKARREAERRDATDASS